VIGVIGVVLYIYNTKYPEKQVWEAIDHRRRELVVWILPDILRKTNKGTGSQSSNEMKLSPQRDSEGYYTILLDKDIYTKLQRIACIGRRVGEGSTSQNDCDETKLTIMEIKIVCEDLDKTQTEIKLKVLGTHKGNL